MLQATEPSHQKATYMKTQINPEKNADTHIAES